MRPRRTILLYCADAAELGMLALKLDLWGYRVRHVRGLREAARLFEVEEFDLVLLTMIGPRREPLPAAALPLLARQSARGGAVLIFDSRVRPGASVPPAEVYRRVAGAAEDLREAIWVAMSRKRGPKKKPVDVCAPGFLTSLAAVSA